MQIEQKEKESVQKGIRKGALAASIICWIVVAALMSLYYYLTTLENFRAEQFALQLLSQYQLVVDFPLFMYIARVFSYALLTAFSYAAIEAMAHIKPRYRTKSNIKLVFLRISISEMLTIWLVFLFSSCMEYYLLFVPGHTADIVHFMQNMFGVVLTLIIIRLVKLIEIFFRYLFHRKD